MQQLGPPLLLLALLCWPGVARGDESPAPPANSEDHGAAGKAEDYARAYLADRQEALRANARAKILEQLSEKLDTTGVKSPLITTVASLEQPELAQELASVLRENNQPVAEALRAAAKESEDQQAALQQKWERVRLLFNRARLVRDEVKAGQQLAGQLAFLLNFDNRWFWLFGVLAIATLVGLVFFDRRHETRRWLNGGKPRSMGLARILNILLLLFVLVTLAMFVCGNWIYNSLITISAGSEAAERQIRLENKQAAEDCERARQAEEDARKRYDAAVEARKGKLPEAFRDEKWQALWDAEEAKVAVLAGLEVQARQAELLNNDLPELEKVLTEVTNSTEIRNSNYRKRQWIRRGLGLGLLLLMAIGGGAFQYGVRRRQEKVRETCPLCLGEGMFEPAEDGEMVDGLSGPGMMQCKSVLSEQPHYEECLLALPEHYLGMPKLCFPTLGIPAAGKTHWLAMTYRELNRNNYRNKVQFAKVRSPVADEFDRKVDEILNLRLNTEPTLEDRLPRPLVFNFEDRDPWGRSSILVNIFDYSGEVMRRQTLEDRQRRRALDGDGFLFFLDPTASSESQANVLSNFRHDIAMIKRLRAGKQLHIPVALCVSKLDLLVNQSYAKEDGEGVIDGFYSKLAEIGWDSSLDRIEARSEQVLRLRDTIWPGWPIERTIHDLFGGRHKFFPVTPVGFNGLGIEDLSRRVIEPLGLLDPLLWLLHMNGYPVFG